MSFPSTLCCIASFATLLLKDLSLLHVIGGGGFGQVWR